MRLESGEMLPEGWRWVPLGEVVAPDKQLVQAGSDDAQNLTYLSMEHIESLTGRILKIPIEKPEDEGKSTTYRFTPSHILYGKLRPYLNKVAEPNFEGRCTTELVPLLPKSVIDRRFLVYTLRRKEIVDAAMRGKTGARMPRANMDELLKEEIPLPPLPEQKRIAAILTERLAAVERARKASEARLEAARALPAAYLREVFESEEARGWPEVLLGDVVTLVQNGIYKPSQFYGKGNAFLRMYNLDNRSWRLNENNLARVQLVDGEIEKFGLDTGDLLISRVNSYELVGKCGIVDHAQEGFVFENMLIRIKVSEGVDPLFIAQQFATKAIKDQIQGVAKRAIGQSSINSTDLRGIKLRLPSMELQKYHSEQVEFACNGAVHLAGLTNQEQTAVAALPASLLRQAFSGAL